MPEVWTCCDCKRTCPCGCPSDGYTRRNGYHVLVGREKPLDPNWKPSWSPVVKSKQEILQELYEQVMESLEEDDDLDSAVFRAVCAGYEAKR